MKAKKKAAPAPAKRKHSRADHPAVGRLDHNFTRTIPVTSNSMARGKTKTSGPCTMCGMDEAFHDLTIADYTGSPEAVDLYIEHGAPAGPFTDEEKAENTP